MKNLGKFMAVVAIFSTTLANAQDARYGIKSGIIKIEATTQGMTVNSTQYFDNYGEKEFAVTSVETPMGKQETISIQKNDTIYAISMAQKIGQKQAMPEQINYRKITPTDIIKYKIKEIGEETVAGKTCKKYSLQQEQMGQTIDCEVSVWNGIVLKTVMKMGAVEVMSQTATEIQENAEVESSKFEIPEGVTFM